MNDVLKNDYDPNYFPKPIPEEVGVRCCALILFPVLLVIYLIASWIFTH